MPYVVNARSYQVQISADGGKTWQDAIVSPKAKPDRDPQSGSGHELSRAGAGHWRQHRREQLGHFPLDHVHLNG